MTPTARERLTAPILPFSAIEEAGAKAAAWRLERRHGSRWGRREKHEISTEIRVPSEVPLEELTDEGLDAMERLLLARQTS